MNSSHSPAPVPVLRIVHTTDFSAASQIAFVHALKLALVAGAELDLLHVSPKGRKPDWTEFPGIHQTLHRWGMLPNRSPSAAPRGSGLRSGKIVAIDRDPVRGALDYLRGHATELLVLATHQRRGIDRWLHKAAAEPLARESGTLTLFLPRRATGFVSHDTGGVTLQRVLVPVDHTPAPQAAADTVEALLRGLGSPGGTVRILHIGEERAMPEVWLPDPAARRWELVARPGNPVDEIIAVATAWAADLIVMTTEGHAGALDALRGSTTERVLRRAPCPVLAVPVASRAMRRLFSGTSETSP